MLITDAAVRETAVTLIQSLGGDWTLDLEAPADGAAHLIHGDGRAISFRPVFGGATVQLWITGNAAPTLSDGATPTEHAAHEAHMAARLHDGHRYNKATTLVTEDDEEPADIILRTLEDHLLPAFEYKPRYVGHRPWIDLFDNALAAVTAERGAPPAPDDDHDHDHDQEPAADTELEPDEDAAGAEAEKPAPQNPEAASEETPSPEPDNDTEATPEPAHDDADSDMDHHAAPKPTPAPAPRPRKRAPKRPASVTVNESAS